eukprot:TRINITY_DN3973_c0_g1_i2.p1 TRINITY_DN3973_c0_g1~~TRINITY_DN3973_c0_g1_i2.p1  ORF type:complete len:377 (+),score=114.28 TRINITY_DN3973_c0_g1_i2:93-1223(+)
MASNKPRTPSPSAAALSVAHRVFGNAEQQVMAMLEELRAEKQRNAEFEGLLGQREQERDRLKAEKESTVSALEHCQKDNTALRLRASEFEKMIAVVRAENADLVDMVDSQHAMLAEAQQRASRAEREVDCLKHEIEILREALLESEDRMEELMLCAEEAEVEIASILQKSAPATGAKGADAAGTVGDERSSHAGNITRGTNLPRVGSGLKLSVAAIAAAGDLSAGGENNPMFVDSPSPGLGHVLSFSNRQSGSVKAGMGISPRAPNRRDAKAGAKPGNGKSRLQQRQVSLNFDQSEQQPLQEQKGNQQLVLEEQQKLLQDQRELLWMLLKDNEKGRHTEREAATLNFGWAGWGAVGTAALAATAVSLYVTGAITRN